jgi:SAM-dependent methyltransferase
MKYLKGYKIFENSLLNVSKNFDMALINKIKKNVKIGSNILEISCGNGSDSLYLKELGYNVICTEIDDEYVTNARKLGLECIKHNTKDRFPFKDKQFDLVYCRLGLHYFTEVELNNILKELKRISNKLLLTAKIEDDDLGTNKIIIPPYHWIGLIVNNYGYEKEFYIREGDLYGRPSKWVEILAEAKVEKVSIWRDIILDLDDIIINLEDSDSLLDKKIYTKLDGHQRQIDADWYTYFIKNDEVFNRTFGKVDLNKTEGINYKFKVNDNKEEIIETIIRCYEYVIKIKSNIIVNIGTDLGYLKKCKKNDIEGLRGVDTSEFELNIYEL